MKKTLTTLKLKRETLRVLTNRSLSLAAGGGEPITEIEWTCTTKMNENNFPVR